MKLRLVVGVIGFAAFATAASAQDAKLVEKGQKLYATNKCATCHSVADKGNKKGPLDEAGSKLSADEIREWLVNPKEMTAKTNATRKPLMTSYAKLSKDDIDALVAFVQSLKKK